MPTTMSRAESARATALAMMVAADGDLDAREMKMLTELDAFRTLGISVEHFKELFNALAKEFADACETSWLSKAQLDRADVVLDAVEPVDRPLVCRLAGAVLSADGQITNAERMLFSHALAKWHIDAQECAGR